jgi:protein-S-isoprenylcysteine O-methyltransferase Ste14
MIDISTRTVTITDDSTTHRISGRTRRLLPSGFFPALALAGLVLWQLDTLVSKLQDFDVHPGWMRFAVCLRSALYALFLCFPIAALLTHERPSSRDERLLMRCVAVAATFFLAGSGLLVPGGLELWHASQTVIGISVAVTLVGVGFAILSVNSLGSSFSIAPQGRALVVGGPYRLIRHPIYLAELIMITGVTVAEPRLALVLGALVVAVLQPIRIDAEERLLRSNTPGFDEYAALVRYRLIPLWW